MLADTSIADRLGVTAKTVANYVSLICMRLGVRDRRAEAEPPTKPSAVDTEAHDTSSARAAPAIPCSGVRVHGSSQMRV